MKKLIIPGAIFLLVLLLTGAGWLSFRARIMVDAAAKTNDPATMTLEITDPPLIRSDYRSDGAQTGLVTLPDGEVVKFWFVSHHTAGPGCARFDFNDGTTRYMWGDYFCCEVQIPGEQVRSRKDLLAFIDAHDQR
ncbi:MAG: hypothetical protein EOP84_23160 [Verrucomicrobiaceae bacterium]|nr:MAG: hypothetical protein EOP84_23160 [Verrucomicrobiaceae bacterium]